MPKPCFTTFLISSPLEGASEYENPSEMAQAGRPALPRGISGRELLTRRNRVFFYELSTDGSTLRRTVCRLMGIWVNFSPAGARTWRVVEGGFGNGFNFFL